MRASADFGNKSQSDASGFYLAALIGGDSFHCIFNQTYLIDGINVDSMDAGAYGLVKFAGALTSAVEDYLVRPKPYAQRLEEFAAAVDLDVDARIPHRL